MGGWGGFPPSAVMCLFPGSFGCLHGPRTRESTSRHAKHSRESRAVYVALLVRNVNVIQITPPQRLFRRRPYRHRFRGVERVLISGSEMSNGFVAFGVNRRCPPPNDLFFPACLSYCRSCLPRTVCLHLHSPVSLCHISMAPVAGATRVAAILSCH